MVKIVDTNDFFNSGILYRLDEPEKLNGRLSPNTHIPTRKEFEEYRDDLLERYRNTYGTEYSGYSSSSIEKMAAISPIIAEIAKRSKDNQFIEECLISDDPTHVFKMKHLEFARIMFGTAKYVSAAD